jgi:hypothetical protein
VLPEFGMGLGGDTIFGISLNYSCSSKNGSLSVISESERFFS